MKTLPTLPEVLRSYPPTARWLYQLVAMSPAPLSQRQAAKRMQATTAGVHANVAALKRGGLITAKRGALLPSRGPELANATEFRARHPDLGPEVIGHNSKVALLSGATRIRHGHPPAHVYYVVQRPAKSGAAPELLFALASSEAEAAKVLKARAKPVRLAYKMQEGGQYQSVYPPFTNSVSVKQKAGLTGKESGVAQRVVTLEPGLYTLISETEPVPAGSLASYVQPPRQARRERVR